MKLLTVLLICFLSFISCTKIDTTILGQGKVIDIDGHVYVTEQIGSQTWMMDDLKAFRYSDGIDIQPMCYQGQYTFNQVNTGKLCPTDWHVPADWEWHVLIDYISDKYIDLGVGYWWSSSTLVEGYDSPQALAYYTNIAGILPKSFVVLKEQHLSIRCIKD